MVIIVAAVIVVQAGVIIQLAGEVAVRGQAVALFAMGHENKQSNLNQDSDCFARG